MCIRDRSSTSPSSTSPSSSQATTGSQGTGGDQGSGGAPGTGGDTGSGGDPGSGGSSGECTTECATNPEELEGISAECQGCAEDNVGACQGEFLACAGAEAGPDDTEGCTVCSEIANTGNLTGLCESNVDEAIAILECICGVCG